jgi:hypothetical protein
MGTKNDLGKFDCYAKRTAKACTAGRQLLGGGRAITINRPALPLQRNRGTMATACGTDRGLACQQRISNKPCGNCAPVSKETALAAQGLYLVAKLRPQLSYL